MALMEIHVPDIGDFDEVTVIELLVQPGEAVKVEQSLITVESDKASMEIPSSASGSVKELKVKKLFDSTWIFVTSPYGQSPIDQRRVRHISLEQVQAAAESIRPGLVAHISGGDVAMIWLTDSAKTDAAVKALGDQAAALGIQDIYSGARLELTMNSPAKDKRMPDIVLQAELGVLWGGTYSSVIASYGGMSDEDTHVALLVSGAQLTGRVDPTWVSSTQLAPLLLRALGMEKFDLDALHQEHSPALPGIF